MMKRFRATTQVLSLLLALGLTAAACGSDDSPSSSSDDTSSSGQTTDDTGGSGDAEVLRSGFVNGAGDEEGEPSSGGEITMGVFSEALSLDPVTSAGTGYAGGTEMAAIFDVLMRYDNETGEYVPQLAESLEPNEDFTEWTLKLRPDVKFSDGTVLDAEVVKVSLERQATSGRSGFLLSDNVESMEVVDPLTVMFALNKSWAGFPYTLAFHPGMITPPGSEAAGADFAKNPIGAGPYTLAKYVPGEEIVLEARDDYWAGRPNIDTIRFKYLAGGQASYDALNSGTFQVALLGEPQVATAAMDAGMKGWLRINYSAGMTMMNVGFDAERPTANQKVRQAVAHAVDDKLMNERVWAGKASPSRSLYGEGSRWQSEVEGLDYDPEKAKDLVEEAKAEGWDGSIEIVASAAPPWNNAGLALQAQLQAVGFDVTLTQPATVGDQLKAVNVDHSYDISPTGYALDEAEPYVELAKKFGSKALQNAAGYKSDEMDALLVELAAAATPEDKIEIIGEVQELVNRDVPGAVWSHNPELLAWADSVHGVIPNTNAILLFHEAWVD